MLEFELIGLTGPSGVGKDYTARQLQFAGFTHLKFANGLRHLTYAIHGLEFSRMGDKDYESAELPHLGYTVTDLLIQVGAQARDLEPNVFCHTLVWQMWHKPIRLNHRGWVISDVRQPNELDVIQQADGTVYRVQRDTVARPPAALDKMLDHLELPVLWSGTVPQGLHPCSMPTPVPTEALLDLYDYIGHPDPYRLLTYLEAF